MTLKCKQISRTTTYELNELPNVGNKGLHGEQSSLTTDKGQKCSIPKRYVLTLMNCLACFIYVLQTSNISIAVLAMVNLTAFSTNQSLSDECPAPVETKQAKQKEGHILWSPQMVGFVLGAAGFGCMITKITGGRLAERFGCKKLMGYSLLMSSLFTMLIPITAKWGSYPTILLRLLTGLSMGPFIPIVVFMLGLWIPPIEKNLHCALIFTGFRVGGFLSPLIFASLCESDILGGWPSVFYLSGFSGLVWACFWFFLIYETPSKHPTITDKELKFILENMKLITKDKQCLTIPWKKMLTCAPVWALFVGFYYVDYFFGFFSTVHPLYLGTIHHLPMTMNGLHSTLPQVFGFLFQLLGGYFTHWIQKRKNLSTNVVAKVWFGISAVISMLSFLGITLVGCNSTLTTMFFIFSFLLYGITASEIMTTGSNLAPAFSGTITGIAETISTSAMFIIPALVGCLTEHEQTMAQWNKVFYINMAVIGSTALIFICFGSSEPQPWAIQTDEEKKKNDYAGLK